MDPVPISARRNTCEEILATTSKLVTIFNNAASLYSDSAPAFTKLSASCDAFAEAIRAILQWVLAGPEKQLLDSAPWYRLTTSLNRAEKTISALQDEVQDRLRSRYESRSASKAETEWDLDSLKSNEEDVQRETEALGQVFQFLQILLVTDTAPIRQANYHDVPQLLEGPAAPVALMASMARGSQADTENTTDRPTPPYNLFDVRSGETHTKWHVDQSVRGMDIDLLDSRPAAEAVVVRPDSSETATAAIPESDRSRSTSTTYGSKLDTTSIRPLFWSVNLASNKMPENMLPSLDLPQLKQAIIEDFQRITKTVDLLLGALRLRSRLSNGSPAQQLSDKVNALWYMCVCVRDQLCKVGLPEKFSWMEKIFHVARKTCTLIEKIFKKVWRFPVERASQAVFGPAAVSYPFVESGILAKHGKSFEGYLFDLIECHFILQQREMDLDTANAADLTSQEDATPTSDRTMARQLDIYTGMADTANADVLGRIYRDQG